MREPSTEELSLEELGQVLDLEKRSLEGLSLELSLKTSSLQYQ